MCIYLYIGFALWQWFLANVPAVLFSANMQQKATGECDYEGQGTDK